jgi:ADP-ribose pyrophosphatase YjhB (NUDIX family)
MQVLLKHDFDKIWNDLWLHKTNHNQYEYKNSKRKFYTLKNGIAPLCLESIVKNTKPLYKHAEWGFPKGRRNLHEKNLTCALREFAEETNYTRQDVQLLDKMRPLSETFEGTNGVPYKHIYYVGHCLFPQVPQIESNNHEVGDIGWFTLSEALGLIRPRHHQRKEALESLHEQLKDLLKNEEALQNKPVNKTN